MNIPSKVIVIVTSLCSLCLGDALAAEAASPDLICAGKNDCKGKGMVEMSEKDCKSKGGKTEEMKK